MSMWLQVPAIPIQLIFATFCKMRLNRTLMERSINLSICPVVSPAGCNFALANNFASASAVIKTLFCSRAVVVFNYPVDIILLRWSIRSLEPEHYGKRDSRDFRQPWHPWWLCLLLKHRRRRFGTKDTRLFYYSEIWQPVLWLNRSQCGD